MRDVRSFVRNGTAELMRVYRGIHPYGPFAITFVLIVVSLAVYSVPSLYRNTIEEWRMKLSAMADDRKTAIELFIEERESDGSVVASFPVIRRIAAIACAGLPVAEADRSHASSLLAMIRDTYGYLSLHVVDPRGRMVAGSDAGRPLMPECSDQIREFFTGERGGRVSFHRHEANGTLTIITPVELPGGSADTRPVCGALITHMNLARNLYALVGKRPFPSRTMETLLVRRQADRLVFLSPLRHADVSPMSHSVPFDTPHLAGSHAARGAERFGAFVDYRGVGVYAVTRPIAGTDAGLVIKVDRIEALADFFRELAYLSVAVLGLLASAAGVGFAFIRRQRIVHLEDISRRDARIRLLMEQANDIILLVSPESRILDCNRRAETSYGYAREELLSMEIADLRAPEARSALSDRLARALARGLVYETEHIRKSGERFPVEVSSSGAVLDEGKAVLMIIRDIGERRESQRRVEHGRRLYAVLSQSNQTIVRVENREELFRRICSVAVIHGGFRMAWIGTVDVEADSVVSVASEGDVGAYLTTIHIPLHDDTPSTGPMVNALRGGSPVICNDIPGDPMFAQWRDAALKRGYRSMGSFPIRSSGTVTHVLNVYSDEVNFFTGEEVRLLSEITEDISFALESIERKERRREAETALRESEARFKLLIENAPDGIFVQTGFRFAFCNPGVQRILGAESAEALVGTPVVDRFRPDFRETVTERIRRLNEDKTPVPRVEEVLLRLDGTPFIAEVEAVPIHWKGEDGALVFFRDISERKLAEEENRRNQEWLRLYFDLPFIGMAVTSPQTKQWLRVNDRLCEILGYPREELVRKSWSELTHPDDLEADVAEFERVMRGDSDGYKMDKRFIRGDGATIYATIDVKCVRTSGRSVDFFVATIQDITERVRAERLLREKDALLREMSEMAHIGGWEFDPRTGRGTWTDEVARIHDLDPERETSADIGLEFFNGEHRTAIENAVRAAVEEGVPYDLELEMTTAKGVPKWVRTIGQVDREGDVVKRVHGTIQDVTERKIADERLRASLREKEVMLKEIHHRVKNNMQVIISLLSLQSRNIRNEDFRRVFNDSVTRIHSMALVHEKLYRSGNFARINFKEYMEGLIDIISRSYSLDRGRITLTSLVPPVEWGVDTAIPCGLIVSEAITNAMKHAFPGDMRGEVRVSLAEERTNGDDSVFHVLEISDNGIGMPEDARFDSAESLGMLLIHQLVQQLEGTVEIVRASGSTVRIRFPQRIPGK